MSLFYETGFEMEFNENDIDDEHTVLVKYFENVLHDIKTPVSIIMSLARILEDTDRATAVKISANCRKILRMIREISDFGRVSAGHLLPKYVNMNIVFIAESITQSIAPLAARKNASVIFDTNTEECIMAVDKDIFERILLNLLSNAIKFAPADSEILVNFTAEESNIIIDVSDEGNGIPDDRLSAVFERYEATREASNPEGTGVGLAIVKELVNLLGGHIEAKRNSEIGHGTLMRLWLPLFEKEADDENQSEDLLTLFSDEY